MPRRRRADGLFQSAAGSLVQLSSARHQLVLIDHVVQQRVCEAIAPALLAGPSVADEVGIDAGAAVPAARRPRRPSSSHLVETYA